MIAEALAFYYKSKLRFTRLKRHFSVPPHYVTLDIGSGDSPFAPADVLCEKFLWDDRERTARLRHDRPLVVGDIEALPFRDKAFDFIHCCHVLEHTFHPDRAIQELMRVGRGGYIEMPSVYLEKTTLSTPGHLWFVGQRGGQLVFTPKKQGILDQELNDIFRGVLMDHDPLYTAFHWARFYSLFNIGLRWEGKIDYRLEARPNELTPTPDAFDKGSINPDEAVQRDAAQRSVPSGWLKNWIHRRAARAKQVDLENLIACPLCHGPLNTGLRETLECRTCGKAYPFEKGIPVLLPEIARPTVAI